MVPKKYIGEAFAVAGAFALLLLPLRDNLLMSIFQSRDLDRTLQLLQGRPVFFGPEAMGGGHLPGGLYYYLLAIPVALAGDWHGAWYLEILLSTMALAALWIFARHFFGGIAAILVAA